MDRRGGHDYRSRQHAILAACRRAPVRHVPWLEVALAFQ
jgi:hypothetical protein